MEGGKNECWSQVYERLKGPRRGVGAHIHAREIWGAAVCYSYSVAEGLRDGKPQKEEGRNTTAAFTAFAVSASVACQSIRSGLDFNQLNHLYEPP